MEDDADRYFDPYAETLSRDAIAAIQERKLVEIVARSYAHSALIRRTWQAADVTPDDVCSIADFTAVAPFIDKDAIRNHRDSHGDPYGGLKIVEDVEVTAIGFTSGTTGDPTPVPISRIDVNSTQNLRDFWHIGGRPGDYVTHVMFTFRGGHNRFNYHNMAGMVPIAVPHDPAEVPFLIAAMRRYRPTVFYMLSTPLIIALEQYFERTGEDPVEVFSSVKGGVFGGEPLSPRFATLLKDWGIEVFELTSLGDVCGSIECREHNGMHAWEDLAFIECLDDDGRSVADGEIGELVVTSLEDPVAPLIRYRTEDLVRIDRSPCPCGRNHLRFWPVGRKGDQTIVQGVSILPRDIQRLVERHRETRACLFQIIRPERVMDTLRLRVGHEPAATQDPDALAATLVQELTDFFQVPVAVELVPDAELLKLGPPQKIPRVAKQ
jgi:phenylacetate-CoA ligase